MWVTNDVQKKVGHLKYDFRAYTIEIPNRKSVHQQCHSIVLSFFVHYNPNMIFK